MLNREEGLLPWTCWLHSNSPVCGQPLLCKGILLTCVQRVVEASPVLSSLPVLPEELVFVHGSTPVMQDPWSWLFIDNHTITSFTKLTKQNTVPFDTLCLERPSVLFIIVLLSFSPVPIWILAGTSLMQMRYPISQISSYRGIVCFSLFFFPSFWILIDNTFPYMSIDHAHLFHNHAILGAVAIPQWLVTATLCYS